MLITDLVNPAELNGYIRGLAQEENRNRFSLSNYLPVETVDDVEFRVTQGNLLDVDTATYRTYDAEAPIGKRRGGTRVSGQIPPLSQKIKLTEEERLQLRAVQTRDQGELIRKVFDDAATTTRAILARLEKARGEALYSGKIILNENGLQATIDFDRAAGHTVNAPILWSDLTNSDPLTDLTNWVQTYVDTNGIEPGFILTSRQVVANILKNAKIKNLFAGPAGTPGVISNQQLSQQLDAFSLPPLVQYNTNVRVGGTATPVIPTDRLILMPPPGEPLGSTVTGITAEALELVSGGFITEQQASGLTTVVLKEFDPVGRWTKTAALALPVLANPNLTLAADVQ